MLTKVQHPLHIIPYENINCNWIIPNVQSPASDTVDCVFVTGGTEKYCEVECYSCVWNGLFLVGYQLYEENN